MNKPRLFDLLLEYLKVYSDFFVYIKLRTRQIWIWFNLIIEFFLIVGTNLKKEVVQRMFWGRASLYRQFFHLTIISITVVALINGVSARIATLDDRSQTGINLSQGHIGTNDMILQYANARVFTVRGVDDLPFPLFDHKVVEGQTLDEIASIYKMDNASSIVWANGLNPLKPVIKPGDILKIPPMEGVLKEAHEGDTARTIIKGVNGANIIDVIELNNLQNADELIEAKRLIFIPNGEIPLPTPPSKNGNNGGTGVILDVYNPGTKIPKGTFLNPMSDSSCDGYSVSRGYASYHTGIDFIKAGGCWIRAAGPGTVVLARWNSGGLGFGVIIEHPGGYSTLYGHGDGTFLVREGQEVEAGQKIMYMGNTGNSVGTHLHFSLTANNQSVLNCYNCRINPSGVVPY